MKNIDGNTDIEPLRLALLRAIHGLTTGERRAISMSLAPNDEDEVERSVNSIVTKIKAVPFTKRYRVSTGVAYRQLINGVSLEKKRITLDSGREIPWVTNATYLRDRGTLELIWNQEAILLFGGMIKEYFQHYHLEQGASMRTVYSWRLLELLSRQGAVRELELELPVFHKAMAAPATISKSQSMVRSKIINPAVDELELNGWVISYEMKKTRRKYTSIRFQFTKGRPMMQRELPI